MQPSKLHMFRHCGGYGWPDQFGRGWYGRRSPFGSLASAVLTVALIAVAVSWWRGRRQPFSW